MQSASHCCNLVRLFTFSSFILAVIPSSDDLSQIDDALDLGEKYLSGNLRFPAPVSETLGLATVMLLIACSLGSLPLFFQSLALVALGACVYNYLIINCLFSYLFSRCNRSHWAPLSSHLLLSTLSSIFCCYSLAYNLTMSFFSNFTSAFSYITFSLADNCFCCSSYFFLISYSSALILCRCTLQAYMNQAWLFSMAVCMLTSRLSIDLLSQL